MLLCILETFTCRPVLDRNSGVFGMVVVGVHKLPAAWYSIPEAQARFCSTTPLILLCVVVLSVWPPGSVWSVQG
jgi:hypothetical protein